MIHNFEDIISLDNLIIAWQEFVRGKRRKTDVQEFSLNLMDNIMSLHHDLKGHDYYHGGYYAFNICDPKPRNIHKASVRDRLVHHAIYRVLYPFFDRLFIPDSYSCRRNKGTHKALDRFRAMAYKVSKNNTKTCWVLKCDIRKFFANIDHNILMAILRRHITDQKTLWLLQEIISSFYSFKLGVGLPLGNLTSQLLVNIYMTEFDQFVKHHLKTKYYLRYADDFVILSPDRWWLEQLTPKINTFLNSRLSLKLHPGKVFITTLTSGVDWLGWVHFPSFRVLRTATKRRMLKRVCVHPTLETVNSYLGMLKHGNGYKLQHTINLLYERTHNCAIIKIKKLPIKIKNPCLYIVKFLALPGRCYGAGHGSGY